ncbi:MAG: monovalent cation/H+ antiporter subunit D family protein [Planctomycetota bacterium]|nr:monovalent cation/H+ antiporter subunit D family protein [Planctomycetota bacterium]
MIGEHLPVLVVVVPLITALLIPLLTRAWRGTGWGLVSASLAFSAFGAIQLLVEVLRTGVPARYSMGDWPIPAGIEYVVDELNGMVLVMIAVAGTLAALWMHQSVKREVLARARRSYYTVFLLFAAGLMGITITGDVFNLYVFLEIASITSYVLIAMGKRKQALYAGFAYLILGSLGATFILLGIGHLYMATGSLAMLDIAERMANDPALYSSSVVRTSFAFFTVGFAIKMALFPLHAWQPNAYTQAPSGATIFIAATATKVSAYGFYRILFTVFGPRFLLDELPQIKEAILLMCVAAIVVGPLLAIRQKDLKRLLAYSSVGQIGYIMLGVVLWSADQTHLDGATGGLMHFWNHAVAKGALFCVAGALVYKTGAARVADLAGMGRHAPWTSAVMTVAGLSMIGVPLTAGFWSKFYLCTGALEVGRPAAIVVLLVSSLLTAVYVWRLLSLVWFAPKDAEVKVDGEVPWSMRLPALVLGAACLYLFFQPIHLDIARAAAEGFMK